jgi:ACS family allantoate permease-like MFS transporter
MQLTYSHRMERFFFPDSPTTAWFLTTEERAAVVRRIQVNQSGVENKHFKMDQ